MKVIIRIFTKIVPYDISFTGSIVGGIAGWKRSGVRKPLIRITIVMLQHNK